MRTKYFGAFALFLLAALCSMAWLMTATGGAPPTQVTALPSGSPDLVPFLGGVALMGTLNVMYDTAELSQTINSLISLQNGLHKMFFSNVKTHKTETVVFDVKTKRRVTARYVHPRSPGKPRQLTGFRTDSFQPAYIKELTAFDPDRAFKRMAGESLMGTMSPQERVDAAIVEELTEHRDVIDRTLERQAVEGLRDAKVIISGEDYPTVEVDFGRDEDLSKAENTLTGGDRWGQTATADPLKTLRGRSRKLVQLSGSAGRHVVLESAGYDAFRSIPRIDDIFDTKDIKVGDLNFNEAQTEGLIYRGKADGFFFYTYDAWFEDENGEDQPALAEGEALMLGAVEGTTHYGAIKDFEAQFEPMPIFTKMKTEWNPSSLQVLSQSSPLVVPVRTNATCAMQVLG
ncbi:MAG TPA: minor capsid protein E [Gemmatimonas aurantiaca]|nr:major capsid protein [Gemmatimonas aurantiaca]HCT55928.1 minor capsid protein E [Gemmatimonas aurantiaca]